MHGIIKSSDKYVYEECLFGTNESGTAR
jgi:hypothetical protein